LTTEQLERIAYALAMSEDRTRETDGHVSSEARICLAAVNGELHRRQRGPFTLAEAIASGRPFRRKEWSPVAVATGISSKGVEPGDDGYYDAFYTAFIFVDANETNDERVTPFDITATDYELMPEGGGE